MLDEHRVHKNVEYASEVLDKHVQELREILPDADEVIDSGENMLKSLKSEMVALNDGLSNEIASVNSYFEMLHNILKEKERNIMSRMEYRMKRKEKQLVKRIKTLDQVVMGMKQSKMALNEAVEYRSKEIRILLEKNQLTACVFTSMRLVEEETFDCKRFVDGFSKIPTFKPDQSVEDNCRSISVNSPTWTRSQTLITASCDIALHGGRPRSNAFVSSEGKASRPTSKTLGSGTRGINFTTLAPLNEVSETNPSVKQHGTNIILNPVSEIGTNSLISRHENHETAYPFGVCCVSHPGGELLVTDTKNNLFWVMTSTGKYLKTIGKEGKGDGQVFNPVAIAVDKAGNTLVLDRKNPGRVQRFSKAGERH